MPNVEVSTGGDASQQKSSGITQDVNSQRMHQQLKNFIANAPLPTMPSSAMANQSLRHRRADEQSHIQQKSSMGQLASTVRVPGGAIITNIPRISLVTSSLTRHIKPVTVTSIATMHKNVNVKITKRDTISEVIAEVVKAPTGSSRDPIEVDLDKDDEQSKTTSMDTDSTAVVSNASNNSTPPITKLAHDEISVAEAQYLDSVAVDYWKEFNKNNPHFDQNDAFVTTTTVESMESATTTATTAQSSMEPQLVYSVAPLKGDVPEVPIVIDDSKPDSPESYHSSRHVVITTQLDQSITTVVGDESQAGDGINQPLHAQVEMTLDSDGDYVIRSNNDDLIPPDMEAIQLSSQPVQESVLPPDEVVQTQPMEILQSHEVMESSHEILESNEIMESNETVETETLQQVIESIALPSDVTQTDQIMALALPSDVVPSTFPDSVLPDDIVSPNGQSVMQIYAETNAFLVSEQSASINTYVDNNLIESDSHLDVITADPQSSENLDEEIPKSPVFGTSSCPMMGDLTLMLERIDSALAARGITADDDADGSRVDSIMEGLGPNTPSQENVSSESDNTYVAIESDGQHDQPMDVDENLNDEKNDE